MKYVFWISTYEFYPCSQPSTPCLIVSSLLSEARRVASTAGMAQRLCNHCLDSLGSKAQAGSGGAIEDDQSSLEGNVAKDVDTDTGAALDAAEASGATRGDGAVVDDLAGDGDAGGADAEGECWRGGAAGEHVAAVRVAVLGAADLLVVGADDGSGEVQQGRASVSDAVDRGRHKGPRAHRVSGTNELPEALAGGHRGVGDGPGVGAVVNEAEVVCTGYNDDALAIVFSCPWLIFLCGMM